MSQAAGNFSPSEHTTSLLRARLAAGAHVTFRVTSTSMGPLLLPGEEVVVEKPELALLRVGDLVLFECEGSVVIHRLVALDRGGLSMQFRTKGDAHPQMDAWWGEEALVGRVVGLRSADRGVTYPGRKGTGLDRMMAVLSRLQGAAAASRFMRAERNVWLRWPLGLLLGVTHRALLLCVRKRRQMLLGTASVQTTGGLER